MGLTKGHTTVVEAVVQEWDIGCGPDRLQAGLGERLREMVSKHRRVDFPAFP
jgi:hypothetical protein